MHSQAGPSPPRLNFLLSGRAARPRRGFPLPSLPPLPAPPGQVWSRLGTPQRSRPSAAPSGAARPGLAPPRAPPPPLPRRATRPPEPPEPPEPRARHRSGGGGGDRASGAGKFPFSPAENKEKRKPPRADPPRHSRRSEGTALRPVIPSPWAGLVWPCSRRGPNLQAGILKSNYKHYRSSPARPCHTGRGAGRGTRGRKDAPGEKGRWAWKKQHHHLRAKLQLFLDWIH